MKTGRYAYHYTTDGRVRFSSSHQPLDDRLFRARGSAIERNLSPAPPPPDWAQDLLRIAKAVYLADKLSGRELAPDRWTRTIELSVQVIDPDRWHHAAPTLTALLEILTADRWSIRFHSGAARHPGVQGRLLDDARVEEVSLFSGGLDSTAYAAERVQQAGGPLLLVSYYDPTLKRRQEQILDHLRRLRSRPVEHRAVLLQSRANGVRLDRSSRSRGLLFLATAVFAAAAHRARQVAVPENGQLAVNPPLTAARVAACSTRSVHPRTLDLVNDLINSAEGDVRVENPLLPATKGEVCRRARDLGLPLAALMVTVSCGQSPCKFGGASRPHHCGHCYPCLIRQSGLLAGVGHDDTPYETDVWALPTTDRKAQHLRALRAWLAASFGVRDLTTDLPLPPQTDTASLLRTLVRGREELRNLFARHGGQSPGSSPSL
ncbi:7-cyano-7-deazaguanine synthase (queuosine biosynthesis) [Micromonospora nigra]|uniref:7-cyano-7-deazaguanine synthase (Queuosine biosynthesis) n=1 Tax=Micromonospora nigra TaxID=145857 RepID=A0A1C6SJP6_9ACTN|nr:7-cyano-7-deazaguanine synthase (queuosine biosynthesis) [Micromonospora nigra]